MINKKYYISVQKGGKGGKQRTVEIIGNVENVVSLMRKSGSKKVFSNIPNGADVHGYRADYANALYKRYTRNLKDISKEEKYICRADLKGVIYDKKAMAIVSENLGHSRISVIAQSYLKAS